MEFTGERYVPEAFKESDYISKLHLKRYEFALNYVQNLNVVDIACGEGYGSKILSEKAQKVSGFDIDQEAINHAKISYTEPNLFFSHGSVVKIPLEDASVDVVVSFETIEHVDYQSQKQFLREVLRVLKPSGLFIVSTPDKDVCGEGHNEFHICEMNKKSFLKELGGYFKNVDLFGQDVKEYKSSAFLLIKRILNHIIKLDKYNLRHKLFPKKLRAGIDRHLANATLQQVDVESLKDDFLPVVIAEGKTATFLVAVCQK